MNLTSNSKGVLLATLGIVILSPDSLLIRLINLDLWTVMFLRGLFMGITLFLLNFVVNYGQAFKQFTLLDRYAWGIICLMVLSSFFFVASIQNTSVAHTLIIVGAAPIIAAIFGLMFLNEKVSKNTWLTICVVVIGLVFVVYDDQKSSFIGDLYALIACFLWSTNFILARLTKVKNQVTAMCISGFGTALVAYPASSLTNLTQQHIAIGFLIGALVGVAFSMITMAPRYIPAAEVAVFMPLESVLGSLLVWWFLGEYPGLISLTAGLVIITAIMLNSYYQTTKIYNRSD